MSDDRWVLIANPTSNNGRGRRRTLAAAQRLGERGIEFSLRWTEARGHAQELARCAAEEGATRVVACGGDGTIHEVVNGLMQAQCAARPPLGLIPQGQCNDLARALRVPVDPEGAVETLLRGEVRTIDLGRAGEHYFNTVITLGFDSAVNEYVAEGRAPKFLKGTASYLWGIFGLLARYKGVWVSVSGDFGEFVGKVFLMATGNSSTYAGRIRIVPPAVMDDGMLDVCLVHSVSRWEILKMLPRTFSGGHVGHPAVELHRVRSMYVDAAEPVSIWGDGERLTQTPVRIQVVPGALRVLAPAGDEPQRAQRR